MTRWQRFRIVIAEWVLAGTGYSVAEEAEVDAVRTNIWGLAEYVRNSGGLRDPRRISAYRKITRKIETLDNHAGRIIRSA